METLVTRDFNLENYPKSWAAIDRLRLDDYLHLSDAEQKQVFDELERFCFARVQDVPPRRDYRGHAFIGSGWEWSVFRKDADTVIKVPAGMFPEVDSPDYLENMRYLYELLVRHYPAGMVAATAFSRRDGGNILEQQFVDAADDVVIPYHVTDRWLAQQLFAFFEATTSLMQEVMWMPDYWLTEKPNGFLLRNVLIDKTKQQFKVVDFSRYLDPSRMYPSLRDWCYGSDSRRVHQLLEWSRRRLEEIP